MVMVMEVGIVMASVGSLPMTIAMGDGDGGRDGGGDGDGN